MPKLQLLEVGDDEGGAHVTERLAVKMEAELDGFLLSRSALLSYDALTRSLPFPPTALALPRPFPRAASPAPTLPGACRAQPSGSGE